MKKNVDDNNYTKNEMYQIVLGILGVTAIFSVPFFGDEAVDLVAGWAFGLFLLGIMATPFVTIACLSVIATRKGYYVCCVGFIPGIMFIVWILENVFSVDTNYEYCINEVIEFIKNINW